MGIHQISFVVIVLAVFIRSSQSIPAGATCTVTKSGWTHQGTCMPLTSCGIADGKRAYSIQGNCDIFLMCCTQVLNQCGRQSTIKRSYFTNPDSLPGKTHCRHRIQLMNKQVCQIRVDFERFKLAQPTNNVVERLVTCRNDVLYVDQGTINSFPKICGNNEGQHVYLHLAENIINAGTVDLFMELADRNTAKDDEGYFLEQPQWRFKITQLECSTRSTTHSLDIKSIARANIDFEIIAPANCLQYYTAPSGVFSSFNNLISSSKSIYLTDHNYAVCFKRYYPCERLQLELEEFALEGVYSVPPVCFDAYLGLPDGRDRNGALVEKLCGKPMEADPTNRLFWTSTPGPFILTFFSAYNPTLRGIRVKYSYNAVMC